MGLKRTLADKLFSDYIRQRDGYNCQRCKKHIDPPTSYIQCSHLFGRASYSVRFDEDNAVALCGMIGYFSGGCHGYFEANPVEHRDFFYKRLGRKRFNALCQRARKDLKHFYPNKKVQAKAMRTYYREKIKALKPTEVILGAR